MNFPFHSITIAYQRHLGIHTSQDEKSARAPWNPIRSRQRLILRVWAMLLFVIGLQPLTSADPQIVELTQFAAVPSELTAANLGSKGTLYFSGGTGVNKEPWTSIGTKTGTRLLKEVNSSTTIGSAPSDFVYAPLLTSGGWVLFVADDGAGRRIWIQRLSAGIVERGDGLVPALGGATNPRYLNKIFVERWNETNRDNEAVLFAADSASFGNELVAMMGEFYSGPSVEWHDINPGPEGSNPRDLTIGSHYIDPEGYLGRYVSALFFSADDGTHGREYVRWDWPFGTLTKKDLRPGSEGSTPTDFTRVGNKLFFRADDGNHGSELWMDNGKNSTAMVKDIVPGSSGSSPMNLTAMDGLMFFTAITDETSRELWKSDGTADGTVLVKDIYPGNTGSGIDNLAAFSNGVDSSLLLFTATNGTGGYELWKSDGTAEGTVLLKDIMPGSQSSNIRDFVALSQQCYFTAEDGSHGRELWVTDGTAEGTRIFRDLVKGSTGSNPRNLTAVLGSASPDIFFTVDNTLYMMNPEGTPAPAPPTAISVDPSNTDWDSMSVRWTPSTTGADGYYLWCNPYDGSLPLHLAQTTGRTSASTYAFDLIANRLYSVSVTAYSDEGGESLLPSPEYLTYWTLAWPPIPGVSIACPRPTGSWSNASSLTFRNPEGFGTDDKVSGFRWAWNTSSSHTFTGIEAIWDSGNLSPTVAAAGDYYLHLRSLNGAGVGTYPWLSYGPFRFEYTPPGTPSAPVGAVSDFPNIQFDWEEVADTGGSEVASYECQIGTSAGGNNLFDGNVGANLFKTTTGTNGSTYYARVRAIDAAGNVGAWSANSTGVICSDQVGSLKVTLSPAIVTISARWRRVGTETWLSNNAIESDVPVGIQMVEFKDVNNYIEPSRKTVMVASGEQATATGTYVRGGSLQVTISPPEAVSAGAQWRYYILADYPSRWIESGAKVDVAVQPVDYVIQFKDLPGWGKPANTGATISLGSSIAISGPDATYSQATGSLQVTISPPEAVAAGAQWKRVGTETWLDSGIPETGVFAGSHTIEFKTVSGWTKPGNHELMVLPDETTPVGGAHCAYATNVGSLLVTILPAEAVEAGVNWRRTGTMNWRSSGIPETNVPTGLHAVEFSSIPGWTASTNQNATITTGETYTLDVLIELDSTIEEGVWVLYR